MKIDITKKEYQTLLETLYISDWVMHTFSNDATKENKTFKSLKDKLLALHEDVQAEDLFNKFSTIEFDEHMHENYIEEYNVNVFWESLIDQLSIRDLTKKIGQDAFEKMNAVERIVKIEEFREYYSNEFANHQLEHLKFDCTQK